MPTKRISAQTLMSWMKDPTLTNKFFVVDCRDDDYKGGHIKGALNLSSLMWFKGRKVLKEKVQADKDVERVVFHCMLSQVRGPRAAVEFSRDMGEDSGCQVYILENGFEGFVGAALESPADLALIEDMDASLWGSI